MDNFFALLFIKYFAIIISKRRILKIFFSKVDNKNKKICLIKTKLLEGGDLLMAKKKAKKKVAKKAVKKAVKKAPKRKAAKRKKK